MSPSKSSSRLISFFIAVTLFFLLRRAWKPSTNPQSLLSNDGDDVYCPRSDVADDILVVLRTGATESREKLPTHFRTTLRCVPNFVLYSDFEEEIEGHHVYDVLEDVNEDIKASHPDFLVYNHLKKHGRVGLNSAKWHVSPGGASGGLGNIENPAWKLDKWKFLPMVEKALKHSPDSKWFVFIEGDSYLVWPNLLQYLSRFDSSQPYYIGKHMYIGDVLFAYGGAGFAISNPAMRALVNNREARIEEYDAYTSAHWAGDCVLGKALKDAGVDMFWAYPHFHGEQPAALDPTELKIDRPVWCYPAITYHHVSPEQADKFWHWEQRWFSKDISSLNHSDVFRSYIYPQLTAQLDHWDNWSDSFVYTDESSPSWTEDEKQAHKSVQLCKALCESRSDCLQYFFADGECGLSNILKLGHRTASGTPMSSGWMKQRISRLYASLDQTCGSASWIVP